MEMSFLDLRKKPRDILKALERGESILLSRRGTAIARIVPVEKKGKCRPTEHPAFGLWADRSDMKDPAEMVRNLRKGRFHAL